ncbi:uncharacterized protein LOC115453733 isoform X2 [Manduca sexta]|nr:uncharacterized protein LOC115453733 isoform X2 [Manduca sexta]
MERWAVRGGSVRLRCVHDVPPHLLDKVVFLRQGTKIFQYIRDRKPPYRNFTTPGAVLNIALATENSIILQSLDFEATGSYSCEVSLDTPIYTKASSGKQLTVFQPQKHHPRIDIPSSYLSSGETLHVNCVTAPALPPPHITWFVNEKKMDELVAHSHKFRVPMNERNGRKGLHRNFEYEGQSTPPSLVALTHASHIATKPPGCSVKENQVQSSQVIDVKEREKPNAIENTNRHKSRKSSRKDLYVTISELQLVATEGLKITCVSTIPEFRSIDDKFADIRNFTVTVDVIKPSTFVHQPTNITTADFNTSGVSRSSSFSLLYVLIVCSLKFA